MKEKCISLCSSCRVSDIQELPSQRGGLAGRKVRGLCGSGCASPRAPLPTYVMSGGEHTKLRAESYFSHTHTLSSLQLQVRLHRLSIPKKGQEPYAWSRGLWRFRREWDQGQDVSGELSEEVTGAGWVSAQEKQGQQSRSRGNRKSKIEIQRPEGGFLGLGQLCSWQPWLSTIYAQKATGIKRPCIHITWWSLNFEFWILNL